MTAPLPAADSARPVLALGGLHQVLRDPENDSRFEVFVDCEFVIPRGAFVGLLGPSGCGKTTLLTVLGLLRGKTSDSSLSRYDVWVDGQSTPLDLRRVWIADDRRLATSIRRRHFGFALQSGELLTALTVAENIAVPLRLNGWPAPELRSRLDELLALFELQTLAHRRGRLSGGQAQRVALARAIAHRPDFLFVDEPTASLNAEMAERALDELMAATAGPSGCTVFMITHDTRLAERYCDIIVSMQPDPAPAASGRVIAVQHKSTTRHPS